MTRGALAGVSCAVGILLGAAVALSSAPAPTAEAVPACTNAIADAGGVCKGEPPARDADTLAEAVER